MPKTADLVRLVQLFRTAAKHPDPATGQVITAMTVPDCEMLAAFLLAESIRLRERDA